MTSKCQIHQYNYIMQGLILRESGGIQLLILALIAGMVMIAENQDDQDPNKHRKATKLAISAIIFGNLPITNPTVTYTVNRVKSPRGNSPGKWTECLHTRLTGRLFRWWFRRKWYYVECVTVSHMIYKRWTWYQSITHRAAYLMIYHKIARSGPCN